METRRKMYMMAKAYIRKYPVAYDLLKSMARYTIPRHRSSLEYRALSQVFLEDTVTFVQIGASDGMMNDPLREFIVKCKSPRGIFVEPIAHSYNLLVKNYSYLNNNNIHFLNCAIGVEDGKLSFYTFRDEFLSRLTDQDKTGMLQKSSFDKDAFIQNIKFYNLDYSDVATELSVDLKSVNSVFKLHHHLFPLDILVVDAEGLDSMIINAIDFKRFAPKVIYYEDIFDATVSSRETLEKEDYCIYSLSTMNCIAVRRGEFKSLHALLSACAM